MRAFKLLLSGLYGLGLAYLVFFARRRRHLDERLVNLEPFRHTIRTYRTLDPLLPEDRFNFYLNLFGNIALFVPVSFILYFVFRMGSTRKILAAASGLSLFIECTQFAFKIGVADIDDVLLNTAGAAVGVLLLKAFQRISYPA